MKKRHSWKTDVLLWGKGKYCSSSKSQSASSAPSLSMNTQEAEKIAVSIKFIHKCKVSINAIENTMRAFYVKLYLFVIFSMYRSVFKSNTVHVRRFIAIMSMITSK